MAFWKRDLEVQQQNIRERWIKLWKHAPLSKQCVSPSKTAVHAKCADGDETDLLDHFSASVSPSIFMTRQEDLIMSEAYSLH